MTVFILRGAFEHITLCLLRPKNSDIVTNLGLDPKPVNPKYKTSPNRQTTRRVKLERIVVLFHGKRREHRDSLQKLHGTLVLESGLLAKYKYQYVPHLYCRGDFHIPTWKTNNRCLKIYVSVNLL